MNDPELASGSVLGIDIGFSPNRRSSAACRLDWTMSEVTWTIERFRYDDVERRTVLNRVISCRSLLASAFDGPLRSSLDVIARYRMAERLLTRGLGKRIGKPGQANAPVGVRLNQAANEAAHLVLKLGYVCSATHLCAIHEKAIVEAFPSSFLGAMLSDPGNLAHGRAGKSDRFYEYLVATGKLSSLISTYLPGRTTPALDAVRDHDDRAALICALTALGVATGRYTAVGDEDGWIVLPPWSHMADWVQETLTTNARAADRQIVREDR